MKTKILILAAVIFCSCETNTPTKGLPDSFGGGHFSIFTVDSCEYIYLHNWFTHKGNCKFCKERNKK